MEKHRLTCTNPAKKIKLKSPISQIKAILNAVAKKLVLEHHFDVLPRL